MAASRAHCLAVVLMDRLASMAARASAPTPSTPGSPGSWCPRGLRCSMNATCRQVSAPSPTVLSIDMPVNASPSSGIAFHVLHATSHALQPMQIDVSVKNPTRSGCPAA